MDFVIGCLSEVKDTMSLPAPSRKRGEHSEAALLFGSNAIGGGVVNAGNKNKEICKQKLTKL